MWGLKNFGINYGLLFTAWVWVVSVMSRLSQMVMATTGSFSSSFMVAVMLLVIGAMFTMTLKPRVLLVLLATFIGFNYGTNLSLFPSFSKDMWGLKNFGINYGLLFTAWGVGGFVMSRLSQMVMATTGSFSSSFMVAGTLLVIGAMFTMTLKPRAAVEPLPGVMYQPVLGATMADGGEKVKKESK